MSKILNILFILILFSCDHGISPEKEVQGIQGTIYYYNRSDSIVFYDLRLVVFKEYPPLNIFSEIQQGRAIVYPPLGSPENLPYDQDSTEFLMTLEQGVYEYIVVAHQYGTDILEDWRAVGQYDTTLQDSLPSGITIEPNSLIRHIDIIVDYDSLPPQPF